MATKAYILLKTKVGSSRAVVDQLRGMEGVVEADAVTGDYDAIAVVNGTQAIYISLKACGVKKDEEVLVPALTFVGTVNAISYLDARPHFVDSQIENFGINCLKLENYF